MGERRLKGTVKGTFQLHVFQKDLSFFYLYSQIQILFLILKDNNQTKIASF